MPITYIVNRTFLRVEKAARFTKGVTFDQACLTLIEFCASREKELARQLEHAYEEIARHRKQVARYQGARVTYQLVLDERNELERLR